MRILNLVELRAWAEKNCPEEYARLPAASSYEISTVGSCVSVCIGTIARTETHHDLISFGNDRLEVQAHLEPEKAVPILVAGNFTRLAPSYYDKIKLSEPFCSIWPDLNDSIGLAKFNALVRYALMIHGHRGRLSDMSLEIHEVFPQLCADLIRGPGSKSENSSWQGGKRRGKGLLGGGIERTDEIETNEESANNDVSNEQQNSRDVASAHCLCSTLLS